MGNVCATSGICSVCASCCGPKPAEEDQKKTDNEGEKSETKEAEPGAAAADGAEVQKDPPEEMKIVKEEKGQGEETLSQRQKSKVTQRQQSSMTRQQSMSMSTPMQRQQSTLQRQQSKVTQRQQSKAPPQRLESKPSQVAVAAATAAVAGKEEAKADAAKPRKPHNVKRQSCAGLKVDAVLQTKTGNLKEYYNLGKKLGQGQFGTTFLCVEKGTGKEYACKSIAKRKLVTPEDVDDVKREIQIMHHLAGHPNVVTIKEAYEDSVAVHVVMELCAGGELFDRIPATPWELMHRDLKPENFLFVNEQEDSPLQAIDFGLSIFFKPGEVLSDVVGSPYYVAPEVLQKHYGPEADVWSAGVIVYILLSGVPPFWGTEQEIFEEVLHGELDFTSDPWPNISESAKDLVKKMLVRDAKKRITAHEVLVIAQRLSEEEIAGLKEMFKFIDTDNSGQITYDELKDGLKRFGADLDESEFRALMQAADVNNNGTIDYEEFVAATLHLNKIEREDNLMAAFSYFDKDGSGYITQDELQKACQEFGIEEIHLDEMIGEVDQDNKVANLFWFLSGHPWVQVDGVAPDKPLDSVVLSRMKQFSAMNKLKKMALKDGRIDYNEFVAMMQKGNPDLGKKTLGIKEALPPS
ncbi:hypothetical protein GOBAR_AA21664 [Gossypium barbadense]|uniref:non-specific serine/threonine protein kinase n=1 Tax=Gossypium barbadense TaxID=3634 RepID=A0A2P5X6P7_GOSBA|nr:hypothetical protein GOBAR_AA21664 [Gossypium barbadense]